MSLWWLVDLFSIVLMAVATILVMTVWVSAMGRWETALITARREPTRFEPAQRFWLEALPWATVSIMVVLVALFTHNVYLERENRAMAKIANERAIAAANATAMANAGLLDSSESKEAPGMPGSGPKDNMLTAPMPMDTDSLKTMTVRDASLKVIAAKKAQQEALDLLLRNSAFGALANTIITALVVAIMAFSLAFFFSTKTNGIAKMNGTWFLYFLLFLILGAGIVKQSGTVKVFREAPSINLSDFR